MLGFVRCGKHDRTADRNGLTAQRWVEQLLHRGIKGSAWRMVLRRAIGATFWEVLMGLGDLFKKFSTRRLRPPSTSTRWMISARRGTVIAGDPKGALIIPRKHGVVPTIPSRLMGDLDDNSTANFTFKDFRRQIRQR